MKAITITIPFPSFSTFNKDIKGATFVWNNTLRLRLWRIWDLTKPQVLFIGLNPSIANADKDDPTIRRVIGFARSWGYGGIHMMNCFAHVATDPKHCDFGYGSEINRFYLKQMRDSDIDEVVFAWGNHKQVQGFGMDAFLKDLFPKAKALGFNRNGSPKHPLFVKADTVPVPFTNKTSL